MKKPPCPHTDKCKAAGEDCYEGDLERAEGHCFVKIKEPK
jgi:hypothetical protein